MMNGKKAPRRFACSAKIHVSNYKLYKIHLSKQHNLLNKNFGCMQKTSFSCEITSIERRTIFDLWQMSYAARSSLRSLRYASQKMKGKNIQIRNQNRKKFMSKNF